MTYVTGTFVVSEPTTTEGHECRACGFDSVLAFPVHVISAAGVSAFGTFITCVRCADMEDDS